MNQETIEQKIKKKIVVIEAGTSDLTHKVKGGAEGAFIVVQ